jgi:hypothetical protein
MGYNRPMNLSYNQKRTILAISVALGLLSIGGGALAFYQKTSRVAETAPSPSPLVEEMTEVTETPDATVAGVMVEVSPTPTAQAKSRTLPSPTPHIECVGPDGKTSKATKADCDNLNAFWGKNKPTAAPSSNNSQPSSSTPPSTTAPAGSPTPQPSPTPLEPLTVSTTNVVVTLKRSDSNGGNIYGPGVILKSNTATGFMSQSQQVVQGQGFHSSSGGIHVGTSFENKTYINPNKPNGTYTGSELIYYHLDGNWIAGPTVNYSITLVD